jgi:phosphoribosyl-AMP cyclohydrolase
MSTKNIDLLLMSLKFDANGLIPAIAQQHDSKDTLMVAWMNRDSIIETLKTGQVCYWSRSRQSLWRKGESSGQVQKLVSLRVDCDADTLLLLVDQTGVACHTGRRSCFYNAWEDGRFHELMKPEISAEDLYGKSS